MHHSNLRDAMCCAEIHIREEKQRKHDATVMNSPDGPVNL